MKITLSILLLLFVSCKKETAATEQNAYGASAAGLTCQTVYSSPSIPNIHWSVTLSIPNPDQTVRLSLKRVSPTYTAFEIDNPTSKSYTLIQRGYACPTYISEAYFYYEWEMESGAIYKTESFQVYEH